MSARGVIAVLLLALQLGCRDEGLVGEGSACAEGCSGDERCVDSVCVPLSGGAAGDDSEDFDEDDRDHDGQGHDGPGDNEGPGDDGPSGEHPGDPEP